METITSTANRWVKLAAQLKMKKYRDREGLFLMEGFRSAEDAWNQGKRDTVCFVTDRALSDLRVAKLAERAQDLHWLFLRVDESLMKKLSGTEHGQGILAILKKDEKSLRNLAGPLHGRYVLLDALQDPGNVGTILRTAAAAGVRGVFLTEGCADPYAEKAVRSSMGSILRVPVYENLSLNDVKWLHEKMGLSLIGTALAGASPYREMEEAGDAVFVFGNEGNGVREEILSLCSWKLFIPMANAVESLNVSASAAVILFHFYRP